MEINLYPEMNSKISGLLRLSEQPAQMYAAALIDAYRDTGFEPDEIPHWIPVSERFPNPKDMKNITVLTCRKSTITGRSVVLDIARWNGADWVCKGKELANVTHWMPLPQPPKVTP